MERNLSSKRSLQAISENIYAVGNLDSHQMKTIGNCDMGVNSTEQIAQAVLASPCGSSTPETEAGKSTQVQGCPGQHRDNRSARPIEQGCFKGQNKVWIIAQLIEFRTQ